jgi:hypothetical protein
MILQGRGAHFPFATPCLLVCQPFCDAFCEINLFEYYLEGRPEFYIVFIRLGWLRACLAVTPWV